MALRPGTCLPEPKTHRRLLMRVLVQGGGLCELAAWLEMTLGTTESELKVRGWGRWMPGVFMRSHVSILPWRFCFVHFVPCIKCQDNDPNPYPGVKIAHNPWTGCAALQFDWRVAAEQVAWVTAPTPLPYWGSGPPTYASSSPAE
jgi:hypothetical protein